MIQSHTSGLAKTPVTPLFPSNVTINPAGPTANTVPTMTKSTTLNTRMTFFITFPR